MWTEALKFATLQFHGFIVRWWMPEELIEAGSFKAVASEGATGAYAPPFSIYI